MRIILDENIPDFVKQEIRDFHDPKEIMDVDQEYKGILDFDLVDMMEGGDIMVTRDNELHKNLLNVEKNSVYYDIEEDNLVETQVKIAYYLKGYDSVHSSTDENSQATSAEPTLRRRFEELKKENARLKSRANLLEGKIKSIFNTAEDAMDRIREEEE